MNFYNTLIKDLNIYFRESFFYRTIIIIFLLGGVGLLYYLNSFGAVADLKGSYYIAEEFLYLTFLFSAYITNSLTYPFVNYDKNIILHNRLFNIELDTFLKSKVISSSLLSLISVTIFFSLFLYFSDITLFSSYELWVTSYFTLIVFIYFSVALNIYFMIRKIKKSGFLKYLLFSGATPLIISFGVAIVCVTILRVVIYYMFKYYSGTGDYPNEVLLTIMTVYFILSTIVVELLLKRSVKKLKNMEL